MASVNLLEIFPHYCTTLAKSGRPAADKLMAGQGFSPELIASVSACVNDQGKVIKSNGVKMEMKDMTVFMHCI